MLEPLDTVYLTYNPDNDDRLAFAKITYPNYEGIEISQIYKLGYQDYPNSQGQTDNVVVTIEQRTWANTNNSNVGFVNNTPNASVNYQNIENQLNQQQTNNANAGITTDPWPNM